MPKLLIETPSSRKDVANGNHSSNFHRKLPARAVSKFVTVPVTLDNYTSTVAVIIQGAERILIVSTFGIQLLSFAAGVAGVPLESTTFQPLGLTGYSMDIIREEQVLFQTVRVTFSHSFLVCKLPK